MSFASIAAALGIGGTAAAGVGGAAVGTAAGAGLGAGALGAGAGLGTAAGAGLGTAGLGAAIPVAGGSIIPAGLGSAGASLGGAGLGTAGGTAGAGLGTAGGAAGNASLLGWSGMPAGGSLPMTGAVGPGGVAVPLSGSGGGGLTGTGLGQMGAESVFGASPNLGGSGAMFNPTAAPSSLVQGGEIMGYSTAPSTPIPGGYDAAGRAALNPSNVGPVQEAGMFTEGFQPGAYEMGAGDSVNKFTPAGMSNLQKAYIGSQIYSAAKPKEQPVSYPSMSMPGVTAGRAAPQMAPRRPLPMGGFMGGGYKPRLGSRRY